jgi:hypothetical protein
MFLMRKLIFIAVTVLLFSYKSVPDNVPYTVEGIVKDGTSGELLKNVHVFTIKGEEEAITDSKGAFRFQSWHQSVVLAAEVKNYQRKEIRLSLPAGKKTILLTKE